VVERRRGRVSGQRQYDGLIDNEHDAPRIIYDDDHRDYDDDRRHDDDDRRADDDVNSSRFRNNDFYTKHDEYDRRACDDDHDDASSVLGRVGVARCRRAERLELALEWDDVLFPAGNVRTHGIHHAAVG
jgi:hypothetical protein